MTRPAHLELKSELGSGTFGVVHAALDRERDEKVAVKIVSRLPEELDWKFRRRLGALVGLRNPSLARLHSVWEEERGLAYCTELFLGGNLRRRIDRIHDSGDAADRWRRRVDLGLEMLQVLERLHQEDQLHLGLKPPNVLFDDKSAMRFSDFGLQVAESDHRMEHRQWT